MADEIRYCNGRKWSEEVLEFLLHNFRVQEPITRSLGATIEDVYQFFTDLRDGGIEHSVLAFRHSPGNSSEEKGELVGVCLNHLDPTPPEDSTHVPFDPFKDYARGDVFRTLGQPKSIFHIDVICVAANCTRQGIGKELLLRSIEAARRLGCQLLSAVATAQASQELFRRNGFYTVRELPFSCFREHQQPVFRNLPDGGRSGLLMACSLDETIEEDLK